MTDTPAHWLRPNEITRIPRRYVYLDTEATQADEGGDQVQTWRLAVTAFDSRQHDGKTPRPREWQTHKTPAELWEWVAARCAKRARTVLVAHNLAYDLRISQAFDHLPRMGFTIVVLKLDSGSTWLTWRRDTCTLVMVDSITWLPAGLAHLGTLVGINKPDLPDWTDGDDDWEARCKADVEILAECWCRLIAFIETEDLGSWKPTGAGQALAAFRHRFMSHRILVHDDMDAKEAERTAAWTGRCEAWRHGQLGKGPWTEWDYGTAYALVCRDCELPVKLAGHLHKIDVAAYKRLRRSRAVLAHVTVTTEIPVVPARCDEGIYWPVGTFDTTVWDVEIDALLEAGATVTFNEAWLYRRAPVLREWANWCLSILDAEHGPIDPLCQLAVKHWSRALVGRLGARWSQWEDWGQGHGSDVALWSAYDASTGERFRVMQAGTQLMRTTEVTEPPDGLPQIMSWVMAECRRRIWAAMNVAGLENVVYVDTDGVYVNTVGSDRLEAAEIPGLRRKSQWRRLTVLGPRQLIREDKLVAAGVPASARKVGPSHYVATTWRQISTSMTRGEADRVVLHDRIIKVKGTDNRRVHLPNGLTAPRHATPPMGGTSITA